MKHWLFWGALNGFMLPTVLAHPGHGAHIGGDDPASIPWLWISILLVLAAVGAWRLVSVLRQPKSKAADMAETDKTPGH